MPLHNAFLKVIKRRLKTPALLPFSAPLHYFWPAMKMITIILLCFFMPAGQQPTHASHEIKAQKHFLVPDVEDENEDEEENAPFVRKFNIPACFNISHVLITNSPNHYKNVPTRFSAKYLFHRVLRI